MYIYDFGVDAVLCGEYEYFRMDVEASSKDEAMGKAYVQLTKEGYSNIKLELIGRSWI